MALEPGLCIEGKAARLKSRERQNKSLAYAKARTGKRL